MDGCPAFQQPRQMLLIASFTLFSCSFSRAWAWSHSGVPRLGNGLASVVAPNLAAPIVASL